MLSQLLRLRSLTHRAALAVFVLVTLTALVRFFGPWPAPAPRWMETYFLPPIGIVAMMFLWVEAAVAGVNPDSIFHVPDAPPFAWTIFALVGQAALWSSLDWVATLFGFRGHAWLTRKLDIAQVALAIGGSIMLVEAWWERHATHPLARWRRLLAAAGGMSALLLAMPWEPFAPVTVVEHKLWLYGVLLGSAATGLVMGWRPKYTTPELRVND